MEFSLWKSILLLVAIVAFLLLLITDKLSNFILITTYGYTRVKVNVGIEGYLGKLRLYNGCKGIEMNILQEQAYSIARGLKKVNSFRPNAHDLFVQTLKNFGIKVVMVKIDRLKEGVYYARLILSDGIRLVSLDSRPSDAIAIATRINAPIYVKNEFLKNICTNH